MQPLLVRSSSAVDREPIPSRDVFRLAEPGTPAIVLQVQNAHDVPSAATPAGDVLYVHGATFGADLSIYRRFDGRSWADALNDIGAAVWGFDFAGYGRSERYQRDGGRPAGRIDEVIPQLHRAVSTIVDGNGGRPIAIIAHSWGGSVAARYAGAHPRSVKALVLFAPIVMRSRMTPQSSSGAPAARAHSRTSTRSHYPVTLLAQYRRFIEDVPHGELQVLDEAHFLGWGAEYLATDPEASRRTPPSVMTPYGPIADIESLWSGHPLYDPGLVAAPTLLVRGAWDSVCDEADAASLLERLGSTEKEEIVIERGTHLLHLESQRTLLHSQVNAFLQRTMS